MLFQGKLQRARRLQRRNRGLDEDPDAPVKEEEPVELERGDFFAMLVSSFVMIFLPAIGVLLGIVALTCLFFHLF